jgi:hypothetical protein
VEETDRLHRWLLRMGSNRARRRAAEQGYERAPLYLAELHLTLNEPGLRRRISN